MLIEIEGRGKRTTPKSQVYLGLLLICGGFRFYIYMGSKIREKPILF